jgi:menaquinone-dependent protoporphyrinogen oxidase
MSRILVVFASSHGQTHLIADAIAGHLRGAGHGVELADAFASGLPPAEDYDAVIVGSRVHMGRHANEVVEYVVANRHALSQRPSAFFSVSMAATAHGRGPDPEGYMETLFAASSWRPDRFAAFAGGLPYRKYSPLMRMVMKWISKRAGHTTDTSRDHEFTDWDQVMRFAQDFSHDVIAFGMNTEDPPTTILFSPQAGA